MNVRVSDNAECDLENGFWFYEHQAEGVGAYFRESLLADLESLRVLGGMHEICLGYHCMPAKRFPYAIYYEIIDNGVSVIAVLDARRDPDWVVERLDRG